MDTHLILSVYIIKVMGRNKINQFRGKKKKSKYQAFRGQKKKKKKL